MIWIGVVIGWTAWDLLVLGVRVTAVIPAVGFLAKTTIRTMVAWAWGTALAGMGIAGDYLVAAMEVGTVTEMVMVRALAAGSAMAAVVTGTAMVLGMGTVETATGMVIRGLRAGLRRVSRGKSGR